MRMLALTILAILSIDLAHVDAAAAAAVNVTPQQALPEVITKEWVAQATQEQLEQAWQVLWKQYCARPQEERSNATAEGSISQSLLFQISPIAEEFRHRKIPVPKHQMPHDR